MDLKDERLSTPSRKRFSVLEKLILSSLAKHAYFKDKIWNWLYDGCVVCWIIIVDDAREEDGNKRRMTIGCGGTIKHEGCTVQK